MDDLRAVTASRGDPGGAPNLRPSPATVAIQGVTPQRLCNFQANKSRKHQDDGTPALGLPEAFGAAVGSGRVQVPGPGLQEGWVVLQKQDKVHWAPRLPPQGQGHAPLTHGCSRVEHSTRARCSPKSHTSSAGPSTWLSCAEVGSQWAESPRIHPWAAQHTPAHTSTPHRPPRWLQKQREWTVCSGASRRPWLCCRG